jgi:glycosyltransferase involved in cell wall biosynthesis
MCACRFGVSKGEMSVVSARRCLAFYGHSYTGYGPSMTFQEVLRAFGSEGIDTTAFMPRLRRRPDNDVRQIEGLPLLLRHLPWRYVSRLGVELAETKFREAVRAAGPGDFVFAFPNLSVEAVKEISDLGTPLIREMIGVHTGTARRIMVEEHAREGLPEFDAITEADVGAEIEWLRHADAIFAPNAEVTRSLLEFGISEDRIMETSYGWSPTRFPLAGKPRVFERVLVLLFVGRVSYAKGAHVLLRAWHQAGCPGRLMLAGQLEPELERRMATELAHKSVERLGFVTDLSATYAAANAFALPTLFEGGPQVTLEAAAHGLPLLVSPMGTARLVDHECEGLVIEPHDLAGWTDAIRLLAGNMAHARRMGDAARARAQDFVWETVSRQRARSIKAVLGNPATMPRPPVTTSALAAR